MALNSYKVHIFAQNKAKKITKTGRGPLFWPVDVAPTFWSIWLRSLARTWQHRRGPPCGSEHLLKVLLCTQTMEQEDSHL